MCSGRGDWTLLQPGFPIRKPPDLSSVASSPGLIACSHVLRRLLIPRHPPCALTNLTTKMKMLASTVQFSSYGRGNEPPSHRVPPAGGSRSVGGRPVPATNRQWPLGRTGSVRIEGASADPSGPNSVPRSLPETRPPVPTPLGGVVLGGRRVGHPLVDVPLHELPVRDSCSNCGPGDWRTSPSSSLERR